MDSELPSSLKSGPELISKIEMMIINGFMNDQFMLGKALNEGFHEKMFKSVYARKIFRVIHEIYTAAGRDKTIDPLIIRKKLEEAQLYDILMKKYFEIVIASKVPELSQMEVYMKILAREGMKNQLREASADIERFVENCDKLDDNSFFDFFGVLSKRIRDIQRASATKNLKMIKDHMIKIAQDINVREMEGERDCLGFSMSPFVSMNMAVSGLRKGFLYGVAGAPRRGKTNFTLDLATYVASNHHVPVLFFTWEQTSLNLSYRLLAKETRINPDTLQRKRIRSIPENDVKFARGWVRMEQYMNNLYIIEGTREDTVERIKAYAYNAMQDHKTDDILIVCDYIQKMPLAKNYDSEKFKVEELSTDLKRLSIELNCPVIVISSLNKEGCLIEMTENDEQRPELYHCKGSGDIEYDLDVAMIMSKDWGDSRELNTQMSHLAEAMGKDHIHLPKIDIVNVFLDKNRDAPEGRLPCIQYFFFIEENRFFELGFKETTNAFRFNKIEALLKKLVGDGFVQFREVTGKPAEVRV